MVGKGRLHPRTMLFTLYGDYVPQHGQGMWVGSLIRLMQCFGISEQSVRSELMRMCRKGFMTVQRAGKRSFYFLSDLGQEIIEVGARRIFTRRHDPWDGRWTVLTYSIPEEQRDVRDRLRRDLSWLGFGVLTPGVYISPWEHPDDLPRLLERYGAHGFVQVFRADNFGPHDNRSLVESCWNLPAINQSYQEFLTEWQPALERFHAQGGGLTDEECFVDRYLLAHDYEHFPLIDPGLPEELWPSDWLGERAARFFDQYHEALKPGALRFFQSLYEGWTEPAQSLPRP